jgi:hypothetical protein
MLDRGLLSNYQDLKTQDFLPQSQIIQQKIVGHNKHFFQKKDLLNLPFQ